MRPRFVLHLHLTFSNEERAIIETRALGNYVFDLSPGYLATSEGRFSKEALGMLQAGSIILFVAGFPLLFVAAAVPALGLVVFFLCFVGGPALWWYALYARVRESTAYTDKLSLPYLVANPSIAIQADNPGLAPTVDENIRARVANLKHFLTKTHDLTSPRIVDF
jgi:cbb3-type cytochrome oxidase subunit 3